MVLLSLVTTSGTATASVAVASVAKSASAAGNASASSCPPISFEEVAGFNAEAVEKFAAFDDYLKTRELSVEGFALEWLFANDRPSIPDGRCNRIPSPKNGPVDIETVDSKGNVIDRYQCKRQLTVEHVDSQKYDDLKFITSRESRERLIKDLAAEEAKAARRGIELESKWKKVRKLVDAGGLVDSLNLSGKPLPTLSTLKDVARRELRAVWDRHLRAPQFRGNGRAGQGKPLATTIKARNISLKGAKLPIKAAAVGGAAAVAAEAVILWYRFDQGELTTEDLPEEITRSAVRVAIVAGAEGALFALMATPAGWVVVGVGVAAGLGVAAVDAAIDWWKEHYRSGTSLTRADLLDILPERLHAQLLEPTALDRWEASRSGDLRAWDSDWTPLEAASEPSTATDKK